MLFRKHKTLFFLSLIGSLAPAHSPCNAAPEANEARSPSIVEIRGVGVEEASGTLKATPVAGHHGTHLETLAIPARLPGRVGIDLQAGVSWRIDWQGQGTWSPGLLTTPTGSSPSTSLLEIWPTGRLTGLVHTTRGEAVPEVITVRLAHAAESRFPPTQIRCPITDDRFSCEVPATKLDLRLRAETFISHFRWAAQVPAGGELDLGTLALHQGASLAGKVTLENGNKLSAETCEIELRPLQAAALPHDAETRHRHQTAVTTQPEVRGNEGVFHFRGIRPGRYVVSAKQPGYADARLYPVEVMENAETEIRNPLVLTRPRALQVELNPPLDLQGKPWRVELLEKSEIGTNLMEPVAKSTADEAGLFEQRGLAPGSYVLLILDSRDNRQLYREFPLRGDLVLPLELPLVWVEGMARIGDEPLAAELFFGGLFGAERVILASDEEGSFAGTLPREGPWEVHIRAEHPQIERSLADVEVRRKKGDPVAEVMLELPATELVGDVFGAGGAVDEALVRVIDTDNGWEVTTSTGVDGSFVFHGLPDHRVIVFAENSHASSEQISLTLSADLRSPRLHLTLKDNKELVGRVMASGTGVPAARVFGRAYENGKILLESVVGKTDIDGSFRLLIPANSQRLDLTVFAPGYSLGIVPAVPFESDEILILEVDPFGGDIVFELAEPIDWADDKALAPTLVVNGVEIMPWTLRRWAKINGEENVADPRRFVVPAMPTGSYTACRSRQILLPEPLEPNPDCSGGYLAPGGSLVAHGL